VWTNTCTSWVARLATASGAFGSPIALPGAADADPGCPGGDEAGASTHYAYSGDIFFADLDRNGYPDIVSAHGHNYLKVVAGITNTPVQPRVSGYFAYLNNSASPLGYSATKLAADASGVTDLTNPFMTIGDVNGDGYPDILRPSKTWATDAGLHWFSTKFPTVAQNLIAANPTGSLEDVAATDADGDGVAEVFRLLSTGTEEVTSPTLNMTGTNAAQPDLLPMQGRTATAPYTLSAQRWTADLNGDGLLDYASVSSGDTATQVYAGIATGARTQYVMPYSGTITNLSAGFEIGSGWQRGLDDGVRVTDFNLDGRDDLVLMGDGANTSGPQRSHVVVLLSNGAGGFTTLATSIPLGDHSDGDRDAYGIATVPPASSNAAKGYRTSVSLDLNGDGLPDFVQLEGGHLVSYVRKGKMPDMMTRIVEGTGHRTDITYAPLSDGTTYTADAACATANAHLGCLVHGRWIVKSTAEVTLERPNASQLTTLTYSYVDGQYDMTGGRGFLGFVRRDVFGPGSRHKVITSSPGFMSLGAGYIYPTALLATGVQTDVDTPQGPNAHHTTSKTTVYGGIYTSGAGNSSVTVLPSSVTTSSYDCGSNGAGGCTGSPRLLSKRVLTPTFDAYGNVTKRSVAHIDSTGATIQTDTDTITYNPADTTNWLVRLLAKRVSTSATNSETVTRTTNYVTSTSDQTLTSIEVDPQGDSPTRLWRTFGRDTRGRLTSVADNAFPTVASCNTSCTTSCTASCNTYCAGSSNVGACLQGCMAACTGGCNGTCETTPNQTRTTGYKYEDADGVYVTTTTNALNQSSRQWRHPGYGFLVEDDDPNQLAQVWTYDTLGRIVSHTERSGSKRAFSYVDSEDPGALGVGGVDYSMVPNDTATAAQQVHLDSQGREVFRTVPVDAARVVTTWNDYDSFGRLRSKIVETGSPADPLNLLQNSYTTTFDDLDRAISECHLDSTGTKQCKTSTFDGLKVTSADESGHTIVRTSDGLGRTATESSNGQLIASFAYGPFGQLEAETVSGTTVGYDILGRAVSLARPTPGIRKAVYNAFGEIVGNYKQASDGTQDENVVYYRDKLGRLTGVAGVPPGPGMSRSFFYDQSPYGSGGANTIGKLIDALDSDTGNQVHFDYAANGLLADEKWMISLAGTSSTPRQSFGSMSYGYDAHGRVSNVTYPQNLPGGSYSAFSLVYGYDPYLGDVSSLTNGGTPIWSIAARNALGEVTQETMKSAGGTTMNGSATYFMPTGQLSTRSLAGPTSQVTETYSYFANALPSTFEVAAPSGTSTESYGYDSLNRLASWMAASGAPSVSYTYGTTGDLAQRSWSGETVTYSTQTGSFGPFTTARTTTVVHNGVTVETDRYVQDNWGRIYTAPTATLIFNSLDELIGAVDGTMGNASVGFLRDALGERLATTTTTYGANAGTSYLITLMGDLYQLKYSAATGAYEERCRFRANGRVIGDVVKTANTAPSATTFYLANNVGSIIAEASDSGTVAARGQRDPLGNAIANPMAPNLPPEPLGANPDGTSRLGFGDHERESDLGLVDMRARFYSPRLGGFVSPDTVIAHKNEARDYFAYAYVWDNPVALADHTGRDFGQDAAASDASAAAASAASANAAAGAAAGFAGQASANASGYSESISEENARSGAGGMSGGDKSGTCNPGAEASTSEVMTPGTATSDVQTGVDGTGATQQVMTPAPPDAGHNTPVYDANGSWVGWIDPGGGLHSFGEVVAGGREMTPSSFVDGGPHSGEQNSGFNNYSTDTGVPLHAGTPAEPPQPPALTPDPLPGSDGYRNRTNNGGSSIFTPANGEALALAIEQGLSDLGAGGMTIAQGLSCFGFNPFADFSPDTPPAPNFTTAGGFEVHKGN
jgi:RHS repeat-associated protein